MALVDGWLAAIELARGPRGAPLLTQRVLPPGVAPTALAVAAGEAALLAVGDGRGRVAVLRPSPNVRCGGVAAAAESNGDDSSDAPPSDAAPTAGDAAPVTTADSGATVTARDGARLKATLDWLRAAGAGY